MDYSEYIDIQVTILYLKIRSSSNTECNHPPMNHLSNYYLLNIFRKEELYYYNMYTS